VGSVSRATVGVCYGDLVEDVDIEMGEYYEFDEHEAPLKEHTGNR